MPQVLTCGLVGTVWESDWSKMDVSIEVSSGDEPATTVEVSASRQSHGLLNAGVARLFQWPSQGWHRPRGDLAGEEFEGLVNAVADALVATLAKMPPGQRAGLRRNPVALQRFQKKFPWGFGVQGLGVSEKVIHVYPAQPENGNAAPRTVGWAFDPATREGKIRADILGCDYAASTRWLLNREIPRRCRAEAGIGVSLLSIQNETLGADKVLEISFLVVE